MAAALTATAAPATKATPVQIHTCSHHALRPHIPGKVEREAMKTSATLSKKKICSRAKTERTLLKV